MIWHFMGATDQNVLKIRMLYRNILPLTGNEKYICKGNHIFMQNRPKCKRFKRIRYNWNTHYQKEKENFSPMFSDKVWSRKEKNYFHNDMILAAAFPWKICKFSHNSPFHPHPNEHTIFSAFVCAASWSTEILKKTVHHTELQ